MATVQQEAIKLRTNIDSVYEAGKKAEYGEFWDLYQNNGNRNSCINLFSGVGWNDVTFNPKNSMQNITLANAMFGSSQITDLQAILDKCNVVFNFSNCNNFVNMINGSSITRLGVINTNSSSQLTNAFYDGQKLKTIDKLILSSTGTQTFSSTFYNCKALENIVIEGVIGNSLDIRYSTKLTHDSLMSIINALKDYSANQGAHTLTIGDVNIAKLTKEEINLIESKGWNYQ